MLARFAAEPEGGVGRSKINWRGMSEVVVDPMATTLRQFSDVFKLRIGASITLCAVAGMATTPGASLPFWKFTVLIVAVFLSSAGAGAFNQYAERGLDARMPRTRNRPFVTGVFEPGGRG